MIGIRRSESRKPAWNRHCWPSSPCDCSRRVLKTVVDPVADARGSVSVIDNTKRTPGRGRQRADSDLFFSSRLGDANLNRS